MLCTEIIAVDYGNYIGHTNTLCGRNVEYFDIKLYGM